ncbi:MAG: hypothetical protein KJO54_11990 [Gammaproteobacteria bacterium]|nr:hypothetical protein [Gammaproteobacteria bacterium]NNF60913.1 hypothetical protein [Gammaproteobacteria bacterium]NNM20532.1 hypothetical protein [Gammaproteobacteria bacterium]
MHESILVYRNQRYLWIALILAVVSVLAYVLYPSAYPPNGGTWLGYTLGTIGALLILWLTAFGIRKRRYQATGKLEGWLSAHVYLGTALLLVATLHAGFQVGWNIHTLAYVLMCATIFSGFYGVYVYLRYPSLLSRNRGDMTLDQLISNVTTIDSQSLRLARGLPEDVREVVTSAINRTVVGGTMRQQLSGRDYSKVVIPTEDGANFSVERNADQARAIEWLASRQSQSTDGEVNKLIDEINGFFATRQMLLRRVRGDISMQARLQFWLYLHIPLAIALIAALAVHIISVFLYW